MSSLLIILLSSVLVCDFAISHVRVLQPLISDDHFDSALCVAVVTAICVLLLSPVTWLIDHMVLQPLRVGYLAPIVFAVLTLLFAVAAAQIVMHSERWLPRAPGFVLLMMSQSALLGVALLGRTRAASFQQACLLGAGAAISFALLLLAFSSLQVRLRAANIPAPFRQAPVGLITLGIMALAVMGFTGLIRE